MLHGSCWCDLKNFRLFIHGDPRDELPTWRHNQARAIKLLDLDSHVLGVLRVLEALLSQAYSAALQAALCRLFLLRVSITDLRQWHTIGRKPMGKIPELDLFHRIV